MAVAVRSARADPIISEFLARNTATLKDRDGDFSDWIELHNPDAQPVNLNGWYLTDTLANRTRWQFPAVSLPPGGYLLVFCSGKNRRDPAAELHANFSLADEGEYLGLVRPDGLTAASEFAPAYPAQSNNVSFGVIIAPGGERHVLFFATPTPGVANGAGTLAAAVRFSRGAGPFSAAFSLELTGAGPGQHIRFVAVPPSTAGAVAPEPTAASPRYSSPLVIAAPTLLRAAVFTDDLNVRGGSAVVQYFAIDLTGTRQVAAFSSRLPVLVIEQHGYGGLAKEDEDRPAWLYGYPVRPAGGTVFGGAPDFASPVVTSIRGTSSANFPKSSYNLEIVNDQGREVARSLLGSRPFDEWALVGPWLYDPAYIRNRYVYALSNRIGRWAPRTQSVEVFLNPDGAALDASDYVGVYALTDKIDLHPDRVNLASLPAGAAQEPEITGAYLLKIDIPGVNEFGWTTDHGLDVDSISSVIVASPKADRLSAAQRTYIRGYVQEMENALHADRAGGWRTRTYLDYLDRASWVDHHLLNTFASNPDAFERSAFFTKGRGGKIVAGPVWDFDRALGSYADRRSLRPDVWYGENAVPLWHFGWWGILATDPEFRQDWVDRWQTLRRDPFSDRNLTDLADQLAAEIGPDAAARDAARWTDNVSFFGGDHAGEMAHLKSWLGQRARWIDTQFIPAPTAVAAGGGIELVPPAGAQIVYTLDGSDPRALGGEPAPNAVFSPGRVTVPATANLHARSYRADRKDAFPGTPWSSAVGGANSTPLSPPSRLANLSSRAITGAGENALIVGVVVADTATKRYLARGVGPGLTAFGAAGAVADPQLTIYSADGTELARNAGWSTGPDAALIPRFSREVGAFALADGSADSALASRLASGANTLHVTTPSGRTGIGLAELYELDTNGRTTNLSTRAYAGADERVLIGGFYVQGTAHKRMLVRGVGPTLRALGVDNALADPVLTLYAGATIVATNDRWSAVDRGAAISAASTSVGAFTLGEGSEDAALLITLAPGAYTVEIRGQGGTEGVALLEIYEVP